MAAQEEKMSYCHGRLCQDMNDRRWRPCPKKEITKVTHGYNIWNKPHRKCPKCFEKEVCKAQCCLCSVWIRQKDDMIEFEEKDYCTYCVEQLEEKDPPGIEFDHRFVHMHDYIEGKRNNDTLIEMTKLIEEATLLRSLKKKFREDPRKKKIYKIINRVPFVRLDRYKLVDKLTEEKLITLSDERIVKLKDLITFLLIG